MVLFKSLQGHLAQRIVLNSALLQFDNFLRDKQRGWVVYQTQPRRLANALQRERHFAGWVQAQRVDRRKDWQPTVTLCLPGRSITHSTKVQQSKCCLRTDEIECDKHRCPHRPSQPSYGSTRFAVAGSPARREPPIIMPAKNTATTVKAVAPSFRREGAGPRSCLSKSSQSRRSMENLLSRKCPHGKPGETASVPVCLHWLSFKN